MAQKTTRIFRAFDSKQWAELECDGYRVRTLQPFKRFRGLDIPWSSPSELEEVTDRLVKNSRSRKVVKLSAGHFGAPVEVYVKRYNYRSWYRWLLRFGRKTRAREEFDLGWKLMEKGIKTPRPVWLAEAKGRLPGYSLLATEALPDVESVVDRWLRCNHERQRQDLLNALGRFVGQVHDARFYHDDFKASHVLLFPHRPSTPDEFYLVDLLGGWFPPVMSSLRRAKNLYQIIRSFLPKRKDFGFTRQHRDVFLMAYTGGSALEAMNWSRWVDRVGHLKGRKL